MRIQRIAGMVLVGAMSALAACGGAEAEDVVQDLPAQEAAAPAADPYAAEAGAEPAWSEAEPEGGEIWQDLTEPEPAADAELEPEAESEDAAAAASEQP